MTTKDLAYTVGWKVAIDGKQYGDAFSIAHGSDPYEVGELVGRQLAESLCDLLGTPNKVERIKIEARAQGFDV